MNTCPVCPACGAVPLREGEFAEVGATMFPCAGCGVMLRFALVVHGQVPWHSRGEVFLVATFADAEPLTVDRGTAKPAEEGGAS